MFAKTSSLVLQGLLAVLLVCMASCAISQSYFQGERPKVLVFEDQLYVDMLAEGPAGRQVSLVRCSAPTYCEEALSDDTVVAVVGQPRNASILESLKALKLVQSTFYMYPRLATLPPHVTVASYQCDWRGVYGLEPIAEFIIAGVFEWNYQLRAHREAFARCAWGSDAPKDCPTPRQLTEHRVLMNQTMGVLGYGGIGEAVARRAAALGMRVVATKLSPPFTPTPPGLAWLSGDNDQLLRESDFVAITVPGQLHGLINRTSLALMKKSAVLIPASGPPVDYDALFDKLADRAIGGAVLDVWSHGCWRYPEMDCGPPYGPEAQPALRDFSALENALVLPGMAMRDDKFWFNSAAFVGENLANLVQGLPLLGVVRNGTGAAGVASAAVGDILA